MLNPQLRQEKYIMPQVVQHASVSVEFGVLTFQVTDEAACGAEAELTHTFFAKLCKCIAELCVCKVKKTKPDM